MRLNILLVVVSLLLVAEAALVYCRGTSEGEEHNSNNHISPDSSEGGCNLTSQHNLQLGVGSKYTLTTCYDESEGSLCLTEVPLEQCSYFFFFGHCYYHRWSSHSITWSTLICQNLFSSGYCLRQRTIPTCSEERAAKCSCRPATPPPGTEGSQETPTTAATTGTSQATTTTASTPTTTETTPTTTETTPATAATTETTTATAATTETTTAIAATTDTTTATTATTETTPATAATTETTTATAATTDTTTAIAATTDTTTATTATTETTTATTTTTETTTATTATTETTTATTATTEPTTATTATTETTTVTTTATTETTPATTATTETTTVTTTATTETTTATTASTEGTTNDGERCSSRNIHQVNLYGNNRFTLATCFDESEGSLCLTRAPPLQRCSFAGQCYIYHWSTHSITWNIILCHNPFGSGYCFKRSSIPIC